MYRECQGADTDVPDVHRTLSGDEGGDVCGTAVGTVLTLSREAICHSSLKGVREGGLLWPESVPSYY